MWRKLLPTVQVKVNDDDDEDDDDDDSDDNDNGDVDDDEGQHKKVHQRSFKTAPFGAKLADDFFNHSVPVVTSLPLAAQLGIIFRTV